MYTDRCMYIVYVSGRGEDMSQCGEACVQRRQDVAQEQWQMAQDKRMAHGTWHMIPWSWHMTRDTWNWMTLSAWMTLSHAPCHACLVSMNDANSPDTWLRALWAGVNNQFLVKSKSSLATLYNNESILEKVPSHTHTHLLPCTIMKAFLRRYPLYLYQAPSRYPRICLGHSWWQCRPCWWQCALASVLGLRLSVLVTWVAHRWWQYALDEAQQVDRHRHLKCRPSA